MGMSKRHETEVKLEALRQDAQRLLESGGGNILTVLMLQALALIAIAERLDRALVDGPH